MKSRVVSTSLVILGVLMISIAVIVKQDNSFNVTKNNSNNPEMGNPHLWLLTCL